MLLSNKSIVRWNSRNKARLESLGYVFTNMGDDVLVDVRDLSPYSKSLVRVRCDYCGKEYETPWDLHNKSVSKFGGTNCCNDAACTTKKAQDALIHKYGTRNIFEIPEIREKRDATNIERYGCANPFASKEIQSKIASTNLEKYGVRVPTQNPEIYKKVTKTCEEKYGVPCYLNLDYAGEKVKGANNPHWKGGVAYHRVERSCFEYRDWRKAVFDRDRYTCQCCGARNGQGFAVALASHHIRNWKDNEDLRYDVDNGVTLCEQCHLQFHSIYGKRHNNREQLDLFIQTKTDKKVC